MDQVHEGIPRTWGPRFVVSRNKDPGLGDSSDEESAFIENDHSSWSPSCFHDHSESESSDGLFNQTPINKEIWDDVLEHEIDEDTFENRNIPSVDVDASPRPSNRTLLNCLLILLAYFWTYFPIPDNAMEFLLLSLKRFFQAASLTNNWLATFAFAFPRSLYIFRREIGLVGDQFRSTSSAQHVVPSINLMTAIEQLGHAKFLKHVRLFGSLIISNSACANPVVLRC